MSTDIRSLRLSRRALIGGVAATGLAAPFLGMRRASAAASGPLNFWSQLAGSKKAAGEALEAAFKTAHPEIQLTSALYADPAQLNEKLLTSINGNVAPDLFIQHWDYTLNYASGTKILDLKPLIANQAELDPLLLAYGTSGGRLVSVPLYGTTRGIGLNKAFAKEAGLDPEAGPKTWAEIRTWAKAMTKRDAAGVLQVAGFDPFHNDLEIVEFFTLLIQGAGGSLLDADGNASFAGPEGIAALSFISDLYHVDKVSDVGYGTGPSGTTNPFNVGRSAMVIAGNYTINNARNAGIDLTILPMPKQAGGFTALLDPFSFAIPTANPNREAALAFIAFSLRPEVQAAFAATSKNVPVSLAARTNAAVTADPLVKIFTEIAGYAPKTVPNSPVYSRISTILANGIQKVLFKRDTPAGALASAAKEAQVAITRSRG